MKSKRSLVYGVGLNDSLDKVSGTREYTLWYNMLRRCYSTDVNSDPSYKGCTVCKEWLQFTTFRDWVRSQDHQLKHLDKDILVEGSKEYHPDRCVFVSREVNNFLTNCGDNRKELPRGVFWDKQHKKFAAQGIKIDGNRGRLGLFHTPEEAHEAWLNSKRVKAAVLAAREENVAIKEALLSRF